MLLCPHAAVLIMPCDRCCRYRRPAVIRMLHIAGSSSHAFKSQTGISWMRPWRCSAAVVMAVVAVLCASTTEKARGVSSNSCQRYHLSTLAMAGHFLTISQSMRYSHHLSKHEVQPASYFCTQGQTRRGKKTRSHRPDSHKGDRAYYLR